MTNNIQIFISCVSDEFGHYRDAMRDGLKRANVETKTQEDFIAYGGPTLEKLDDYIRHCEAVIHIVGNMTGSMANQLSLKYINEKYPDFVKRFPHLQTVLTGETGLSYTQWEAYLAIYHNKRLFVATPEENAIRNNKYNKDSTQTALQETHLKNLRTSGYYPEIQFRTEDDLIKQLYQSRLGDIIYGVPKIKPVNLPYKSIGSNFKGRELFINDLHEMFSGAADKAVVTAVHGLGGMGKTRLAVEYAWQHIDDYTALLFITATSPDLLKTHIANLCDLLQFGISGTDANLEDIKYAAVIDWLNQYPGWLLVIDNVDTQEAAKKIEGLSAQLQRGHVLITTRTDRWGMQVKKKRLDVLDKEDAVAFLLEATDNEREKVANDVELAYAIADDVGCLALALEQARAYIVTKELSFEKYRKRWEQSRADVLSWFDEQLMQYPRSVAVTWQTSFSQLSDAAITLMNRLAWLSTEPIPKTLLAVEWEDAENLNAQDAWEELKQYSLTTSTEDKKAFTVHKLVQDVTLGKMDENSKQRTLTEVLLWLNEGFAGDPTNVFDWPVLEPLMPHVLELISEALKKGINFPTSQLMTRASLIFLTKAQYTLAEPLMKNALEIDEQSFGPDHPDVARDLNNLAQVLQDTNRLQEAERLMKRALKIDEQSLGPDDPKIAIRLNNLAQLLQDTNRLQEAEPLMKRALEIDEQSFGPNHPKVAIDLNNLAQLLKDTNRLQEAEPLMKRALEIDEHSFGPNHPKVSIRLNNLAQLLQATNRLPEAEPLMKRALEIDEQSFGPNHPNVARDLNNLAQFLKATNRLQEAEPLMKRALQIDEQSFGTNHPDVAIDLNNLAQLLQATNRLHEAEPLMKRALQIDEQSFGANHPHVARDLNNLAQLLKASNRLQEAETLQKRPLIIFRRSFGTEHPFTETARDNYVAILEEMSVPEEEINICVSKILSDEHSMHP
jgi:tetratricopeptide (TPR) repeat protein